MRITLGLALLLFAVVGCVATPAPQPQATTRSSDASRQPAAAAPPTQPPNLQAEPASCYDILPVERIEQLRAERLVPVEVGFSAPPQDMIDRKFAANGGVHCSWHEPDRPSDAIPVFAFSRISSEEAREVQAALIDSGYSSSETNGTIVMESDGWGAMVYVFAGTSWVSANTLNDAELVLDVVTAKY